MDLIPIIDRLKTHCPSLRGVGDVLDLARANESLALFPSAFILPVTEQAAANADHIGPVWQPVESTFGVLIALRDLAAPQGVAKSDLVEQLRNSVRDALLGYAISDMYSPIIYANGDLVDIRQGAVWWQDNYKTTFYVRQL